MNLYKVNNRLSPKELLGEFIKINTGITVLKWQPLINDDCEVYAKATQPIIRVDIKGYNWLRVYVDKNTNEITWY